MLDASQPASVFLMIASIWSIVGLAFYVWYLWSLSRLFPYLGLKSSHGWIPIWNQWVLLERGGFPGALILLALLPGLGIVPFVLMMIGINRIHREYGANPVFLLLAIFLPPVWAMVLTSYLEQLTIPGRTPGGSASGRSALAAATGGQRMGAGRPQPPISPTGAAPWQSSGAAPAASSQAVPSVPQAPQAPAAPASAAPISSAFPVGQPSGPVAPPAPTVQVAPAANAGSQQLFAEQPGQQQAPYPPTQYPPAQHPPTQPPAAGVPGEPDPSIPDSSMPDPSLTSAQDWGLSRTTEDAYQRLADEGSIPQEARSIAPETPARPFMWPEPEHLTNRAATPPAAPTPAGSAAPPAPATEAAPAPAVPAAPAVPSTPAPVPAQAPAGEDDRTVVVPRWVRWGLELPDLSVVEFPAEDVIVGRKPVAPDGAEAVTVPDPTRTLSKSHARFRLLDEGWTIEDLSSTNGCATIDAEGVMVDLSPATPVLATERLLIGTLEVRLIRIDPASSR